MLGNEARRKISEEKISKLLPEYYSGKYESTAQFIKENKLNPSTFFLYLKRKKLRSIKSSSRRYHIDEEFFVNIDTEEKAYWLGFLQCDGYIQSSGIEIALCYSDEEHIKKFLRATNSTYKPTKKVVANKYLSSRVCIISKKMVEPLVFMGLEKFTSKDMKLLLAHDNALFIHYIRGIIDANGSMHVANLKGNGFGFGLSISSGSIDFIMGLKKELELYCGIEDQVTVFKALNGVSIREKCAKKLLIDGYLNPVVSLDRKQEKANAVLQRMCINL